jgi:hypothetical protein
MNAIIPMFFITVFMLAITVTLATSSDASMGCIMLGTEINGDYSTEYLFLGDCR